jgi:hypothetical protein
VLGSLEPQFQERVAPQIARPAPEAREHGLRLAAAALLHPDFIDAKIRARARSGLEKG